MSFLSLYILIRFNLIFSQSISFPEILLKETWTTNKVQISIQCNFSRFICKTGSHNKVYFPTSSLVSRHRSLACSWYTPVIFILSLCDLYLSIAIKCGMWEKKVFQIFFWLKLDSCFITRCTKHSLWKMEVVLFTVVTSLIKLIAQTCSANLWWLLEALK